MHRSLPPYVGISITVIAAIIAIAIVSRAANIPAPEAVMVVPVSNREDLYSQLKKSCEDSSCCLSSVDAMRTGGFELAGENGECPPGNTMNILRCKDSKRWCEPVRNETALPSEPSETSVKKEACVENRIYKNQSECECQGQWKDVKSLITNDQPSYPDALFICE